MSLLLSGLLLLVAVFAMGLQRAYQHVPLKELRRRARQGDELAKGLYRAAAYGYSLRLLLIGFSLTASALLYLYVSRVSEPWLAAIIIIFLLWFIYIWLPAQTVQSWMVAVAARVAPAIASVLQYIHPAVNRVWTAIQRYRPVHIHTGMFEIEDIVELLKNQQSQRDNRIPGSTIHTALSALTFSQKPIHQVYTPRRVVHSVSADDTVGPVLMNELHDSGFSRFPVYEGESDNIVGILLLRDLVAKKRGGKIRSYMTKRVCYVHEDQTLRNGLDAILKTHQQLFIVVNSFEEYVGVISIEDILEQVLGEQIVDEFDAYEDMRAVAASQAKQERTDHDHPAGTPEDNQPN